MEEKGNLCMAAVGSIHKVVSIKLPRATQMRLTALGLTMGTYVKVLNNKRSGAVIFYVRGTRLAVGKKIAQNIYVI